MPWQSSSAPSVSTIRMTSNGPGSERMKAASSMSPTQKRQIGMGLARLRDHSCAEIHANAERRLERGQQVAGAAAELEHAGAFRNQKLEIEQILAVEEGAAREPRAALGRARVGEAANGLLARRQFPPTGG